MAVMVGEREVAVDLRHLSKVLEYLEQEERPHYEAYAPGDEGRKGHIWLSVKHLQRQMKRQLANKQGA